MGGCYTGRDADGNMDARRRTFDEVPSLETLAYRGSCAQAHGGDSLVNLFFALPSSTSKAGPVLRTETHRYPPRIRRLTLNLPALPRRILPFSPLSIRLMFFPPIPLHSPAGSRACVSNGKGPRGEEAHRGKPPPVHGPHCFV
jgi:hypothetical protein